MMGMGQKAAPALAAGNVGRGQAAGGRPVRVPSASPSWPSRPGSAAGRGQRRRRRAPTPAPRSSRHAGVDKISFTGGAAAAREVMRGAAESLTPLALELGGKSANIVFADADLDAAAIDQAGLLGAVLLSGQGCALPTRLFVHAVGGRRGGRPRWSPRSRAPRSATRSTRPRSWARWPPRRPGIGCSGVIRVGPRARPCSPAGGPLELDGDAGRRLVAGAHRADRCRRRCARRLRRGLRPGAQRVHLRRRGRGRRPGQRPPARPGRLRPHEGPRPRPPRRRRPRGGHGHRQRLPEQQPDAALRRGEGQRLRPRRRPGGPRGVPPTRRTSCSPTDSPAHGAGREGGI